MAPVNLHMASRWAIPECNAGMIAADIRVIGRFNGFPGADRELCAG